MVEYYDTFSARKAIWIMTKITPYLGKTPVFHMFLGIRMVELILATLRNSYHQDIHTDCISLLTEIYVCLRPSTDLPKTTIMKVLGMSEYQMHQFESEIGQQSVLREQIAVMKEFLVQIEPVSDVFLYRKQWC
jgi:Exportin-5 family